MNILMQTALAYLGTPYHFGGKSPVGGIDCSGFVSELLKGVAILPWNAEINAQGIHDEIIKNGRPDRWGLGALAFYGSDVNHIDHVAFCLDQYRMVEAGGGDHLCLDVQTAALHNACVRVRPIKFRRDFLKVVMPDYGTIGVVAP
jgi:cell wall-associated NlpC family hydrolase